MIKNKGKKTFLNGNNFLIHKTRTVFQHADGLLELLSLLSAKMKEIPFRFVGYKVWTELANKLDPDTGLIGNNWRMLAEKLGYSTEVILVSQI